MTQIKPNSLAARDIAYHLHGYTNAVRQEQEGPQVLTEGKGIYVYDENGREFIEGMAGLWSVSLGFGEERLIDAAVKQMKQLPFYHTFTQKSPAVTVELAEKLIGMAPVPMSKVFFANSGSEANDTIVKMVWYYSNARGLPNKKKIISRRKGYHGVTVASASLTGLPNNHRDFDLPIPNILHTDCPHYYRFGQEGESEAQFAQRMADSLEKLILAEGPDTIAAFIAEPVMGAGGVILPPAGYFDLIQPILQKHDILFIADEIICGFGRTGNMFGSQTYKLKPDMMSMAKALSSSYLPISAVMINEKVYKVLRDNTAKIGTFGHGFTYSGHPVSAAVALETLKIYEERNIVAQVRQVAPVFQRELRRFTGHPLVGEARSVGLIGALELVKSKPSKEPFTPQQGVGVQLARNCQEQGLITRAIADSIAFCPPLIITEAEIEEMFRRFAKALDTTWAWVGDQGLVAA
jgi:4-aminobutyrate--pyruvate transaminase